MLSINNQRHRH